LELRFFGTKLAFCFLFFTSVFFSSSCKTSNCTQEVKNMCLGHLVPWPYQYRISLTKKLSHMLMYLNTDAVILRKYDNVSDIA
jgi:hypothetical protein